MRSLQDAHQHGRPDRADRRDPTEQPPRLVLFALLQQLPPYFLAQSSQSIELLVVKLRAAMHTRLDDLRQPLRTMAQSIDLLAGARNSPVCDRWPSPAT